MTENGLEVLRLLIQVLGIICPVFLLIPTNIVSSKKIAEGRLFVFTAITYMIYILLALILFIYVWHVHRAFLVFYVFIFMAVAPYLYIISRFNYERNMTQSINI